MRNPILDRRKQGQPIAVSPTAVYSAQLNSRQVMFRRTKSRFNPSFFNRRTDAVLQGTCLQGVAKCDIEDSGIGVYESGGVH